VRDSLLRVGTVVLLSVGLIMTTAGCGGSGETIHLDVLPQQQAVQKAEPEGLKIVIEPFEDRRADKQRIGMRTHLWGGTTHFNVSGQKPGVVYAEALADRLRAAGWLNRSWDVRVAPAGSISNPDIVISGQIFEFVANAKSRMFSTYLTTSNKLTITARNNVDRSSTSRSLESAQSDTVVWFSEDDVKRLLTATVKETIDRYLADTTVSEGAVRPAR
jgi:beta-lactam-binding protein with PASTA domain